MCQNDRAFTYWRKKIHQKSEAIAKEFATIGKIRNTRQIWNKVFRHTLQMRYFQFKETLKLVKTKTKAVTEIITEDVTTNDDGNPDAEPTNNTGMPDTEPTNNAGMPDAEPSKDPETNENGEGAAKPKEPTIISVMREAAIIRFGQVWDIVKSFYVRGAYPKKLDIKISLDGRPIARNRLQVMVALTFMNLDLLDEDGNAITNQSPKAVFPIMIIEGDETIELMKEIGRQLETDITHFRTNGVPIDKGKFVIICGSYIVVDHSIPCDFFLTADMKSLWYLTAVR